MKEGDLFFQYCIQYCFRRRFPVKAAEPPAPPHFPPRTRKVVGMQLAHRAGSRNCSPYSEARG